MALPTALFAMIASFALASAAVLSSVDAQQGSSRDRGSKNAIAAADAGANLALLRLNRFKSSLKATNPCVSPAGEAQQETYAGSGWCPATSLENVGGSTFWYQVSAYRGEEVENGEEGGLTVVSVGTAGGVSRRVEVGLHSYDGKNVFEDAKLIGQNSIIMKGNGTIEASVSTNGSIEKKGGSGEICADVRVGVGQSYPEGLCPEPGFEATEGEKNLPAIVLPEDIATLNAENGTCRLELPHPESCVVGEDTYNKARTSTEPWAPGTGRPGTINVGKDASLTMGGEDYLVCGLFVKNGQLYIGAAPGQEPLSTGHVRIFVDTPEHCGLSAGATQVEVSGNANIVSTGYNPAEGKYEVPVIYVLGSPTISTRVKLCGTSGNNELILYAPYSDIEMCGDANWIGMIAGKSLALNGNGVITSDPHMPPPKLAAQSLWERTRYVECTGVSASLPDASC